MRSLAGVRPYLPAIIAGLIVAAAASRIVATYSVFSAAFDEPSHVAAGMEWLDQKRFTYEPMNPPLARVAVALGPFLSGIRSFGSSHRWREGRNILYAGDAYTKNLSLARLGVLPFFLLASIFVWLWTRQLFGDPAAAAAVGLFATLPPILAHAGFATTDLPLAATLLVALYMFTRWLDARTLRRTLWLAVSVALALLTKLSTLLFLPAAGALIAAPRWVTRSRQPRSAENGQHLSLPAAIALAVGVVSLMVWTGYRFSVGPVSEGVLLPAPEFWIGIRHLINQNRIGHEAFLFGRISTQGWWYFFPVALAVKTAIPFIVLTAVGTVAVVRLARRGRDWRPVAPIAAAVALVLVSIPSNLNMGIRHVLAVYPLAAVLAGYGTIVLWHGAMPDRSGPADHTATHRRVLTRALAVALLLWQATGTWRAHPDYLPWFNELAGSEPDRILVNSDLDWGQDLLRLADTVRAREIDSLALAYFGTADPTQHFAQVRPMAPFEHPTGWFAVSIAVIKGLGVPDHTGFEWLESEEPMARIGKSMRLYYSAPGQTVEQGDEKAMRRR